MPKARFFWSDGNINGMSETAIVITLYRSAKISETFKQISARYVKDDLISGNGPKTFTSAVLIFDDVA